MVVDAGFENVDADDDATSTLEEGGDDDDVVVDVVEIKRAKSPMRARRSP